MPIESVASGDNSVCRRRHEETTVATVELWIQLENHAWDISPRDIDRMHGIPIRDIPGRSPPVMKSLTAPTRPVHFDRLMFLPLSTDALILRRYRPPQKADGSDAWTVPDDRKVNPWDLNEPDPGETNPVNGTMGTIPGATIECQVGDRVVVHFRNMDTRVVGTPAPSGGRLTPLDLVHSLHTHGFVFDARYDGAYPLSPEDSSQLVASEPDPAVRALWQRPGGGVTDKKRGDRVPPGGTFNYTWETFNWPTAAGVWLYHDHSVSDTDNVSLGAIGFVVIHNPNDPDDIVVGPADLPDGSFTGSPIPAPEKDPNGQKVRQPPDKAQYLLMFHTLSGETCINGRLFLGNTPTLIAGLNTRMRFGVVGMGNATDGFHTFHIHGHRWVIPGPDGTTSGAIQGSAQVRAVSQFEDTRVFGPANSFSFTINQGSFMGSVFTPDPARAPGLGEWHMHCHVLDHMTQGMMGSLKIVQKDELLDLPSGERNNHMLVMRQMIQERMERLLPRANPNTP
jgi:FtsP/CotA-like multicopper oxidase with cupredoxin domain